MGGQLAGDHPVRPRLPGGHELLAEPADPALDVGGGTRPLVGGRRRQHDVGGVGGGTGRRGHRHHEGRALEGAASQGAVGEVRSGSAPSRTRAPSGSSPRPQFRTRRPAWRPCRGPGVAAPVSHSARRTSGGRPRGSPARAAVRGPCPCRAHRARSPAAGRGGSGPGQGGGQPPGGFGHQPGVLGQGGPAEHHHHPPGSQASRRAVSSASTHRPRTAWARRCRRRAPTTSATSPGRCRSDAAAVRRQRGGVGRELDERRRSVDGGGPEPQEQDRQLLADVAGEQDDGLGGGGVVDGRRAADRARSPPAGRHPAGRPRSRCR